jgi:major membrane immunogen (membrane-anchored lipoprotein)
VGVAKDVLIHPVRVLDCEGQGTLEQVIDGIEWIAAHHQKPAVANLSLGGSATQSVDDAVAATIASGVTFVVAAGNDGWDACATSPAREPLALTVGATGPEDLRAWFSNFGTCVDLFAPGQDILSAWFTGETDMEITSGTSMATPHVAGAVALYLEGHPTATPREVGEEIIARSTPNRVFEAGVGSPNRLLHSACMGKNDAVRPLISLTSPTAGATLSESVTLTADASDDVGVTHVEFYANGSSIGSDTTAPYSVVWSSRSVSNGQVTFSARAFDSGCNSAASSVTVTIANEGIANYDPRLRAPRCSSVSNICDSVGLLQGRGTTYGPERNHPNTLDRCPDGELGEFGLYQFDASLERLTVTRVDGTPFAAGKEVKIEADFWASFEPAGERLDLYYAADANAPVWTYITTLRPYSEGFQRLSTTYLLPQGGLQAVRGIYRSGPSPMACTHGGEDDHDDLVFPVGTAQDTTPPTASVTAPASGATLKSTVTLSASASDNFGVARVDFYVDSQLVGSDSASPYSLSWDTRSIPNGAHSLSVVAYDATGLSGTSASVPFTVDNDLTPPTVSLTAPAAGATVSGTVTLSASASDNVGISKVEFFDDSTLVGTDASAPYSVSWNSRSGPNGPRTLTATAYDAVGNFSTSAAVTVTTNNDFTPPTVAVTSPSEGSILTGTVTFQATASDDRGIARVEFYAGSTGLCAATAPGAPVTTTYSCSANTRNLPNGIRALTAKAYDAAGNSTTSAPVSITLDNDLTAPTSSITSPTAGSTVGGTVTLEAAASDDRGTVSRVEFYVGTHYVGMDSTEPFTFSWNTSTLANGTYSLRSKAFDPAGNNAFSATVSVNVLQPGTAVYDSSLGVPLCSEVAYRCDTTTLVNGRAALGPEPRQPNTLGSTCADGTSGTFHSSPSIDRVLVSRTDGTPFAPGKEVKVEVTVWTSSSANERLDLYYAPNANAPAWTYLTTLTPAPPGASAQVLSTTYLLPEGGLQALRARYRSGGSPSECSTGSLDDHDDLVFAVGSAQDTTPPTASLTAPASGATVSGTLTLSASVSDNFGVARVDFYVDSTLVGSDTSAPYSLSWDSRSVANGAHSLSVVAHDAAGLSGSSASVPITVNNDLTPPTVSLTAPASGATVSGTVTLSASASDNVGVTKVEFFDGSTLIGTDTAAPYSVSWTSRSGPNGPHPLTAKAYDAVGNSTTSAAITVTVNNDLIAPTVTLTAPTEGSTLTDTVTFQATASDNVGVTRVEFYAGTTSLCADATAPYACSANTRTVTNGPRALTAKAYDAAGNITTSAPVNVTLDNDLTAPTTSITSPTAGATVSGIFTLEASASDDRGTISKVEFYVGTTYVGMAGVAPFRFAWNTTTLANGTYSLRSKAFDSAGNNAFSATVSVNVLQPGTAVYDSSLGAPLCSEVTHRCDTTTLVNGRAALGPEPRQPNTLGSTCADGTSGAFHSSPSIDRVLVSRLDGTPFAPGKEVKVDVTVWVSSTANERLDLYYAPNANAPEWTYLTTLTPSSTGAQVLSTAYLLPQGSLQALRASYRSGGSPSGCPTGSLNDRDDLVFAVGSTQDTTPPTTSLVAPASGATVAGPTVLSASASDNFGVARVDFYVDSTLVGSTVPFSPYSITWDARTVANGAHSVSAVAYDAAGLSGTSTSVPITVNNDLTAPTVSITAPASGITVASTGTVSASASDNVGVTKVEFFDGSTLIGSDTTAPYSASWNTRSGPNGPRTLTATAYDAAGNSTTSAPVTVTADNDFVAPTVTLTSPTEGAILADTVTFQATASDDRGVTRVEFYAGTTSLCADTTAPYACSANTRTLPNGPRALTAKASDASGNITTSAPVNVTLNNDLTAPTTSITSPTAGATVSGTVTIEATASDDRALARVEFYVGTNYVGTDTTAPYTFSWNTANVATGTQGLRSRAVDASGNNAFSATVSVTVSR